MLVTTTDDLQGYRIDRYLGLVVAPTVLGGVTAKNFRTGIRDQSAGQLHDYGKELDRASEHAVALAVERASVMGANALVGVRIAFDTSGQTPPLMLVCATGTAVVAHPDGQRSFDMDVSDPGRPRRLAPFPG